MPRKFVLRFTTLAYLAKYQHQSLSKYSFVNALLLAFKCRQLWCIFSCCTRTGTMLQSTKPALSIPSAFMGCEFSSRIAWKIIWLQVSYTGQIRRPYSELQVILLNADQTGRRRDRTVSANYRRPRQIIAIIGAALPRRIRGHINFRKATPSRCQPRATVGYSLASFMKSHPAPRRELSFAGTG
jgi:hypothetical protein